MRTSEAKTNISNETKTASVFKPTAEEPFFKANQPGFFGGFPVQAKLKVGAPNDSYEREADVMADKVMRMPEPTVQRSCSSCSGKKREDELYRKPLVDTISRTSAVSSSDRNVSPGIESAIRSGAGNGQSLPESTRSFMESRFGTDFSGINIHTDSHAQQLNSQLGARAFTYGNDIFFNRGEYNPSSGEGKNLLAHELTHVVQQKRINKDSVDYRLQKKPKKEESCPKREKGEVHRHQTSNFEMEEKTKKRDDSTKDNSSTKDDNYTHITYWIIYNFGIGESSISEENVPYKIYSKLRNKISSVNEDNGFYKFLIFGSSDCSGSSELNESLRNKRAFSTAIFLANLLNDIEGWPKKIIETYPNPTNIKYVEDESTEKNRSFNRSVTIIGKYYQIKPQVTPWEEIEEKGGEKLGHFVKEAKEKLKVKKKKLKVKKEKAKNGKEKKEIMGEIARLDRLLCILDKLYSLSWDTENQRWRAVPKKEIQDYISGYNMDGYFGNDWGRKNDARKNLEEMYIEKKPLHEYFLERAYWVLDSDSFIRTLFNLDLNIVTGNAKALQEYTNNPYDPRGHSNSRRLVMWKWIRSRQENGKHFYSCYDQKR